MVIESWVLDSWVHNIRVYTFGEELNIMPTGDT